MRTTGGTRVEDYIALYRKWRPEVFSDVVGQDSVVKTLENSLTSRRISHAYLFAGPRGTGKTSVARILAKGLNCQSGPTATPCGQCTECQTIREGTSLNVVEIDGASNRGIDDVRELRNQVQFAPVNANYKVYIIDEVHMLTPEAFNALLKTLEEPPRHVVFIFATTDPHRLPPTILSRVQRFDFTRFTAEAMVERLEQVAQDHGFEADVDALRLIAMHAAGGMRDALSILEKCAAFANTITTETVAEVLGVAQQEQIDVFAESVLGNAQRQALNIIDDLYNQGRDLTQFALAVIARWRQDILEANKEMEPLRLAAIEQFSETVREMRFAMDPRIALELAVLKVTAGSQGVPAELDRLEEKVRTLEAEISKLQSQLAGRSAKASKPSEPAERKPEIPGANDEARSAFVLKVWPEYLKRLRDERLVQCEAFLKEGRPVGVEGQNVLIAFPRDRGFHRASIEQDSHREPAERVMSKFMGLRVYIKCMYDDEIEPKAAAQEGLQQTVEAGSAQAAVHGAKREVAEEKKAQSKDVSPATAAEEFLKASMETFGGKIITKPKEN